MMRITFVYPLSTSTRNDGVGASWKESMCGQTNVSILEDTDYWSELCR